jgi:hypothetical protein
VGTGGSGRGSRLRTRKARLRAERTCSLGSPPTGHAPWARCGPAVDLLWTRPRTGLPLWTHCGLAPDRAHSLDSLWTRPTGLAVDSLSGLSVESRAEIALWTRAVVSRCGLAPDWTRCGLAVDSPPNRTSALDSLWSRPRPSSLSGFAVDSPDWTRCGLALWTLCGIVRGDRALDSRGGLALRALLWNRALDSRGGLALRARPRLDTLWTSCVHSHWNR